MASRGCLCWGLAIFSNPLGPAGLRTLPKLGWPHLVPRWGYSNYTRGESPPSLPQVTGGESTSIWAGIPPEKALVRGAEGQSRMGSPWLFPSMQLLRLQLQQLQEVGSMAHTTLACSPQYRRAT